jgi:UDP-glucose 4-epimerase
MKKRVLITGGLGFIGSQLARKNVSEGNNVTILSKSSDKINNISDIVNCVKLSIKDIRNITAEDVSEKDYIFHLAGTVDNYAITEGQPYKDIEINCNGTIAMLEAIKEFNPKTRLIFASTFFVNGRVKKIPVDSNSPCNPLGLYGATRLAAEQFCHIYHNVFDLDPIIARFSNVFGPFEKGDNRKKAGFNYLINQAVRGEEIKVYNAGNFFRDYIYVDDVVDACQILAKVGETDKVYYVGRSEFVKFSSLIEIIKNEIPELKTKSIGPPEFHKRVGINNFVCDNSQLRGLGWSPKVSLEDGIKKTIKYYRSLKNE